MNIFQKTLLAATIGFFLLANSILTQNEFDDINFEFEPCNINNLDDCFRETVQSELTKNINGNPDLNIPPLNPWIIEKQNVNYNGSNSVEVQLILENVQVYGLPKMKIESVRTSLNENGLRAVVKLYIPKLEALGKHKGNIKINELRVRPNGEFNITLFNVRNTHRLTAEFVTINDRKHLKLKSVDLDSKVENFKFNATGIFPDPNLNEVTVQLINRSLPTFYSVIIDESKSVWEPQIIEATNQFLKRIPFDKLVAENSSKNK